MVFGTLGLHLAFAVLSGNDLFRPLLWLNPFLALLSGGGNATDTFARGAPVAYRTVLSLPPQSWAPGLPAARVGHRQSGLDRARGPAHRPAPRSPSSQLIR